MTAGNGLSEVKMALMVFAQHLAWYCRSWLIWNGWNYNRGSGVARIYGATRPHQPPRADTASVLALGVIIARSPAPNIGGQSQSGIFCQVSWRFGIHFTFINNLGRNFLAKYEGAQRWPLERVPMPQTARNSQWEEHFLGKLNINITLMLLITGCSHEYLTALCKNNGFSPAQSCQSCQHLFFFGGIFVKSCWNY